MGTARARRAQLKRSTTDSVAKRPHSIFFATELM